MVADTLKKHAEIEIVPAQPDIGAVGEARKRAVAYLNAVVGVELAVAVGITVEEVAELGRW